MRASHDIAMSWIRSTWLKLVGRLKVQRRKDRQFVKRTELETVMVVDKLCATVRVSLSHVLGGGDMEVTQGGQIACDQLRLL